jgi:type I restriction enzyme S subunit
VSWPLGKVSDIADVISGYAFKSEWFGTGKDKIIRIGDLQNNRISDNDAVAFSSDTYCIPEQFKIQSGDILMALSGATVGKIAIAQEKDSGSYLNQRVAIVRGKSRENTDYLKYVFSGQPLKKLLLSAGGAAQPNLSSKSLVEMEIPLPPLPEQKRIAAILDKADGLRRKNQQAIQLADQFLRAVFLDMFGDPVTNSKGWELKSLKELTSKIGSGSTPRGGQSAYVEEGISLIRSLNIHDDKFLHKNLAFITDKQAAALSNVEVEQHDVLLNITGASVCRCAMVDNSILPARVNQHVCIIRTPELIPEYLLHMLISTSYKRYLLNVAGSAGATREALTKEQVENLLIPVPPKSLQEKFAAIKSKVKAVVITENEATSLPVFDSLSQKAFAGEL